MYERTDQAGVWLLPEDVEDLLPWTLAALREWHDLYPNRFPSLPDWPNDRRFRSSEETRLHKELDEKTKEIAAAVDRYYDEKTAIEARLAEADAAASGYERALLTEQGDRLEIGVLLALQELGFSVRHMDAEREGQPKKEDYRITDTEAPDWTAIAEAKGFIKGVKEVGMISLERWATAYVHETGQEVVCSSRRSAMGNKCRRTSSVRWAGRPSAIATC